MAIGANQLPGADKSNVVHVNRTTDIFSVYSSSSSA